jgi:hypothetical protein
MALNKSFRVKDSLYVGTSGFFAGTAVSIDTSGKILSAGTDLIDIFQDTNLSALTQGNCIANFTYNGDSTASVGICTAAYQSWDTAATTAAAALPKAGGAMTGAITTNSTFDGVDVGARDAVLTTTTDTANAALPKAGGAMTGPITTNSTFDGVDIATRDGVLTTTTTTANNALPKAGGEMSGNITFSGSQTVDGVDISARDSILTSTTTTATNACTIATAALPKAGGAMTGAITTNSTFDGVDVGARDAVLTTTTGTANAALPRTGGTMSGAIAMGTCKITGLGTPTANTDAATKAYVDACDGGLVDSVCAGNSTITVNNTDAANPTVKVADACITEFKTAFDGVAAGTVQATAALTPINDGSNTTITINGLGEGDSPQFTNICATGNIDFDGTATGDGSGLTGVTATPSFPTTCKANLASTDKLFINDNASCQVSGNKHVEYCDLLTDIAGGVGTGLAITSGSDSICLKNASGLTANTIAYWDDTNGQLANSIITRSASQITVGGDHVVTGDASVQGNLTVTGDFTCLETTVSTTSALSVTNLGTGPALFVKQGGTQPIAHFIDSNGGDIIFADDGKLGIGTSSPSEKLEVVGGITASNNLTIAGNASFGNSGTGVGTVVLYGSNLGIPQIGSGTQSGDKVLVRDSSNCVKLDSVDPKIFTSTTLVDGSGTCFKIPKYTGGCTIGNSNITDTGTLVTIDSDTKVDAGHSLSIYAAGGSVYAQEKTFTASVGTGGTTVATFAKSGFDAGKYIVTLIKGVNKTVFEILVTYNDSASFGTVYGIVDAQATSQLVSVDVTNTGSTIDLVITSASATTTAIVHGKAFY